MGSKWRKAKLALGLNMCVYVPRSVEDSPPPSESLSDAALLSPVMAMTPTPSSHGLRLSRTFSRSSNSKKTCSICLAKMKPGDGQAIFTAECSHSFHFHCIASNVKHGNQICPVCRAKWKEIPLQGPNLDRARINPIDWSQHNAMMTVIRRLPPARSGQLPPLRAPEPAVFDDDEPVDHHPDKFSGENRNFDQRRIEIETFPEVSEFPQSKSCDEFTILIHLKAPVSVGGKNYLNRNLTNMAGISQNPRAPVDLVTVLDTSGSMAGTKLALLKRAMGFVIQNLGPNDRLAVISFSSTARRIFPLRRMSDAGKQQALLAVNSLVANGGTNIAEGLRKGAKIMEDRRGKNPVSSIILLSDGQDTYTVSGSSGNSNDRPNYRSLLPLSMNGENNNSGFKIPVHSFGFGADHDASSMHSISEISGGTFSFIETEGVIQDAFAQCIGGLLSVVVKDMELSIESVKPGLLLRSIKAGSYRNRVVSDGLAGVIIVGDLYADEERDFLVTVNLPAEFSSGKTVMEMDTETPLLSVKCAYIDPLSKETVVSGREEVRVRRPESVSPASTLVSVEVDRQRNRIKAAEAMTQARTAAEQGDLSRAVFVLESCRKMLLETVSAKSGDGLWAGLDAELREMQERMASRHVYEASGRAYILSGLSSHSWQRATARGDSTDGSSLVRAYQTPSMTEMLNRSQASLPISQPKPR